MNTKDGKRASRPRILNGLLYCSVHDCRMLVGGHDGHYMVCPRCQEISADRRPLFTMLNRCDGLILICDALRQQLTDDESLVAQVCAECRRAADAAQRPDPERLARLRKDAAKLQAKIEFNRRDPGETDEEQAATRRILTELRAEFAKLKADISRLDESSRQVAKRPTIDDVRSMLHDLTGTLVTASEATDGDDMVTAHEIIALLTGGRIDVVQAGEPAKNRGWLQGRFRVDLLEVLSSRFVGPNAQSVDNPREVVVDFRREQLIDRQADEAKRLYDEGKLNKQIAAAMRIHESRVVKLLDHAFARLGQERPDGRIRRAQLEDKQVRPPSYKRIAQRAAKLSSLMQNDGNRESRGRRKR